MENFRDYIAGDKLIGDDFTTEQIKQWYEDEKDGYANLGAKNKSSYKYVYHAINILHGYRHLKREKFNRVLGLGSAYGDEFLPIIKRIQNLTILEPSNSFVSTEVHGIPCTYISPSADGVRVRNKIN